MRRGKIYEYLSLKQTAENGELQLEEYRCYVVKIESQVQRKLILLGCSERS